VAAYLDAKLRHIEKLLGGQENIRCEVELGKDAPGQRHGDNLWFAEIHLYIPGQKDLFARNNSESINGAIDDVKEEIERQIRKSKRLYAHIIRRGGALAKRLLRFDD
jgi:ribosomal subunit interface protein